MAERVAAMTWGEVKAAAFRKMGLIDTVGVPYPVNHTVKPYIHGMADVANEGIKIIFNVIGGKASAVVLSNTTADTEEIKLPYDSVLILPLYMASQLYKDDDRELCSVWRNEFENALARTLRDPAGESEDVTGY
jgi:hypothetical protein